MKPPPLMGYKNYFYTCRINRNHSCIQKALSHQQSGAEELLRTLTHLLLCSHQERGKKHHWRRRRHPIPKGKDWPYTNPQHI